MFLKVNDEEYIKKNAKFRNYALTAEISRAEFCIFAFYLILPSLIKNGL